MNAIASEVERYTNMDKEEIAVNITRLQEREKSHSRRQDFLERTLTAHIQNQSETNKELTTVAYQSRNEMRQAKWWITGAITGVGFVWILITNLDKVKPFLNL